MKKLYSKPYFYFWLITLLVFGYKTIRLKQQANQVVNIDSTYFVIAHQHLTILICSSLLILGLFYFLLDIFKIKLNSKLTIVHTCITLLSILIYPLVELYFNRANNKFPLFDSYRDMNGFITFIAVLIIFGQLVFIFNIAIGQIKCY